MSRKRIRRLVKSIQTSRWFLPVPGKGLSVEPVLFDLRLSVVWLRRTDLPVLARSALCGFVRLIQTGAILSYGHLPVFFRFCYGIDRRHRKYK